MKILVATEDLTFSISLSQAYKAAGHDVSAGLPELYLDLRQFDLIHFHWPEELTGWEVPPSARISANLLARLDALKPAATMVCTVHNLAPHADRGGATWALYDAFYARMDVVGHFSEASRDAVAAHFPAIPADKHVVHGMQDFANLRRYSAGRAAARARLGLPQDARIVAAVGQLRSLDELALLAKGLDGDRLASLHFLRACRVPNAKAIGDRIRRRMQLRLINRRAVTHLDEYIDDALLVAVCEAADIIVIPRMGNQLNSGVVPLAMTFGTALAAPDCGVFREVLGGTMNELYPPGDAAGLAKAIERLATKDLNEARTANLAHAADWGWPRGISRILAALP